MAYFFSDDFAMWQIHAFLKQSVEVILCVELKQKFWSQHLQYWRRYLEIFIRHFAAAVPLLKTDNISPVYQNVIEICPVLIIGWRVPEKIMFYLLCSETKYRYFIWAKRSTARRAAMVHSARSIAFLLASFDVVLPSEREQPSWIDWKIEISPSTRWGLLSLSPARRSSFRVSHHTTYCVLLSLTSYRPDVHTCSHFGVRVRRRHMQRERESATAGPLTFWQRVSQWVSLPSSRRWLFLLASHSMALTGEPLVVLISFT